MDFGDVAREKIDVSAIDAKTGVGGNQALKFIGKQGFHDVKSELHFSDRGATCKVQKAIGVVSLIG
ncbi:MAG: hypothetical protein R3D30_13890 [Hyphomicrobiales bacterium]